MPSFIHDHPWPIVYAIMESTEERTGLLPGVTVCATREAAVLAADEKAGRFAAGAGDWQIVDYTDPSRQEWQREVPNMQMVADPDDPMAPPTWASMWQHIMAESLVGAHSDPALRYGGLGSRVGSEAG